MTGMDISVVLVYLIAIAALGVGYRQARQGKLGFLPFRERRPSAPLNQRFPDETARRAFSSSNNSR